MNQIVYSKSLILLLAVIIISPLEAKLLKPTRNGEEKEVLIVNTKRRLYYPIKNDGILYAMEGPMRLEFISRYPVLRKKKKSHSYHYRIVLDGRDTVQVNHGYKVQKAIKSIQHPN